MRLYPSAKEVFEKNLKERINDIKPRYNAYIDYTKETLIGNRVTEYALSNERFTFEEIYNFAVQGINKVVNSNVLEAK